MFLQVLPDLPYLRTLHCAYRVLHSLIFPLCLWNKCVEGSPPLSGSVLAIIKDSIPTIAPPPGSLPGHFCSLSSPPSWNSWVAASVP